MPIARRNHSLPPIFPTTPSSASDAAMSALEVGRTIIAHDARLMPAKYVRPHSKGQ